MTGGIRVDKGVVRVVVWLWIKVGLGWCVVRDKGGLWVVVWLGWRWVKGGGGFRVASPWSSTVLVSSWSSSEEVP